MDFKEYVIREITDHPSVMPQDIVKLCYQAAFGAEHLLSDSAKALVYLENELSMVSSANIPLYEPVSDNICRINLAAWKHRELPASWLFEMFASTAAVPANSKAVFDEYIKTAEDVIKNSALNFSLSDWQEFISVYRSAGISAVHHSTQYRECEKPAYRIVNSRFIRLLPILEKLPKVMTDDKVCVIAIDGRAASGKSTMAEQLETILGADTVHMDDFFLPPELRTDERFNFPGGNVHYERFTAEVLPFISIPDSFSYRIFDCGSMSYVSFNTIKKCSFRIVEGSYSLHPVFGEYADIAVFSAVEPSEQMHRIRMRNGAKMAEMFRDRWIPLEEAYFEYYSIMDKANIIV